MQTQGRVSALTIGLLFLGTLAACSGGGGSGSGASGDDGAGSPASGGASAAPGAPGGCPSVGSRACPNDEPVSAGDVKVCEACAPSWQALTGCQGNEGSCGPDGKKAGRVKDGCGQAYADYVMCALGTAGK
jgi:hypothetical protein